MKLPETSPCPSCGCRPTAWSDYVGYSISCECHDPTPMYSEDVYIGTAFSGHGKTEAAAILAWNRSVEHE